MDYMVLPNDYLIEFLLLLLFYHYFTSINRISSFTFYSIFLKRFWISFRTLSIFHTWRIWIKYTTWPMHHQLFNSIVHIGINILVRYFSRYNCIIVCNCFWFIVFFKNKKKMSMW